MEFQSPIIKEEAENETEIECHGTQTILEFDNASMDDTLLYIADYVTYYCLKVYFTILLEGEEIIILQKSITMIFIAITQTNPHQNYISSKEYIYTDIIYILVLTLLHNFKNNITMK